MICIILSVGQTMSKSVGRSEVRSVLADWQAGLRTSTEVHAWAETRFAVDDWECEDDIANEVLAQLDMLDMNLLTADDIPVLLSIFDLPAGEADRANEILSSYFAGVDLHKRKKALANDPLYARFCGE
jgi:hypothetical protein